MGVPRHQRTIANQDSSAVRTLLQEAKKRGYQVVEGRCAGESLSDGPTFLLKGVQQVRAWFNSNGMPRFQLLA